MNDETNTKVSSRDNAMAMASANVAISIAGLKAALGPDVLNEKPYVNALIEFALKTCGELLKDESGDRASARAEVLADRLREVRFQIPSDANVALIAYLSALYSVETFAAIARI